MVACLGVRRVDEGVALESPDHVVRSCLQKSVLTWPAAAAALNAPFKPLTVAGAAGGLGLNLSLRLAYLGSVVNHAAHAMLRNFSLAEIFTSA